MNINQLESYNLSDAVKFHDNLNPLLWDRRENLHPEIRDQLMAIASDFSEFLGVKDLDLKDITISGSNAAYSYTPYSDIDLHLVVDLSDVEHEDVYRELFTAKKSIYNKENTITIKGIPVEVYVQDAKQDHHSQGIYSILNNEWIQIPRRIQADIDDMSVRSKYEDLSKRIKKVIKSNDLEQMNQLMEKIRQMRGIGLAEKGEFGPENLAFKLLRNTGDLKKLQAARQAAKDQELSLKERVRNSTKYGYGTDYIEEVGMTPDGTNPTTSEFTNESQLDEVGLTPDGTNPTTCQFTNEDQTDHKNIIKDFMEFCADQLGIDKDISLRIRKDPQWSVRNKTFGRYNDGTNELEVGIGGRHIMDVLRTVAHELVHQKQNQNEQMPADAGEDGSKYENEANARAGVLMRQYGKLHPELFAVVSDLDEYLAHITPYDATGGGMGTKTGIKSSAGGLGTIGAFGSVAEELNKKVIAHGYMYNRRDQRESWTKEFASEAAAIEWARRRNATLLSVVPKQKLSENAAQNLPSVLYHATYKPRLKSIKLKGLGAGGKRNWEDSQRGVVYLALDPNVAESYAETSDMVPDEWLDSIVILKIATAGLDPNKFHIDSNVQDNTGDTLEYHGIIPPSNISLYNQGMAEGLNEASGYIPTAAEADDPRFEMALTVDVRPGALGKAANSFLLNTDSQGHPQELRPDGLVNRMTEELALFKKKQTTKLTENKLKFSRDKLDDLLNDLCEKVIKGQEEAPDFYGMVAAAVIDPTGKLATGINYLYGNERIHAERDAIDNYEKKYGELPPDCIVVTTLSPCNQDTGDVKEITCTEVLNSKHVKIAYCGYRDPTQHREDNDFKILITKNNKLEQMCKELADTFLKKQVKENIELDELKIDNVNGIGSVPWNQEIGYMGLNVLMKPSIFLKLALPIKSLSPNDEKTVDYLKKELDNKGIGAPFLQIDIPQEWKKGITGTPARVVGHEGRHRMLAIQSVEGDNPVQVHLLPRGFRNRDFKAHPEWVDELNALLISETGNYVTGPLFQNGVTETKGIGINVYPAE
jgi:pyrimidine deaminase RibD-like protein